MRALANKIPPPRSASERQELRAQGGLADRTNLVRLRLKQRWLAAVARLVAAELLKATDLSFK